MRAPRLPSYRTPSLRTPALLLLACFAASCAGSSIEGSSGASGAVSVETRVNAHAIRLGGGFGVACTLLDANGDEASGAATFSVEPGTFGLDGLIVLPREVGVYTVTCHTPDGSLVDPTPEVVQVASPRGFVSLRTRLPAAEIPACWDATVLCEAIDAEGNAHPAIGAVLQVTPTTGLAVTGRQIHSEEPGGYEIACAMPDEGLVDAQPPTLTVLEGLPARITTVLDPPEAAPGEPVTVLCEVEDSCGDPVTVATRVAADAGAEVDDHTVTAAEAGSYTVVCHTLEEAKPPTEDLVAELYVVDPPEPDRVEITVRPQRNLYALDQVVTVFPTVYDVDGSVIEDPDLEWTVPPEMADEGDDEYRFTAEGSFTFVARLRTHPELFDEATLTCDDGPPTLVIFSPERGSTFDGQVPVTGLVTDVGGVASLKVNDVDVPVAADGSFATTYDPAYGLNVLWFVAKDSYDRSVRTSRALYYSTDWLSMEPPDTERTRILDSLLIFLGQEALDDGDHDPANIDDIATLIEILLTGLDPVGMLLPGGGGPIELYADTIENVVDFSFSVLGIDFEISGDLIIEAVIEEIIIGGFRVSAIYRDGGIDLTLGIVGETPDDPGIGIVIGLSLGFDARIGFYRILNGDFVGLELDPPPTVHTQTAAYAHGVSVTLGIDADMPPGGDLTVALSDLQIDVESLDLELLADLVLDLGGLDFPIIGHIDLPEIPLTSLVQGLDNLVGDTLIDPLLEWIINGLSDLLGPMVGDLVTPLIEGLVDQLVLDLPLPLPQLPGAASAVTLNFSAAPSSVHMDPDGGTFGLAAGLTADKGIERDPLGTLLRGDCAGTDPAELSFDPTTPMAIAFHLDFVNEALFALWWGGGINLVLDLDSLGGLGGVASGDARLEFLLPPILTDCGVDGGAELQLGDMYLVFDGGAMGFSGGIKAWTHVRMGAELTADGDTLGLAVSGNPRIELEITETWGAFEMFASMLPSLIQDTLIPMLVDGISDALGAIPIPEIDLSSLVPGIPPGTTLSIGGLVATTAGGYVLLGGALQ